MKELEVSHNKRNHTLDVIRGVAVLLIILHHVTLPKKLPLLTLSDKIFNLGIKILVPFNNGGWIAVDLFFVLSGFLVSGLLFNEYKKTQNINIKKFLIRRGFKIYPGFFIFMALTFISEKFLSNYTSVTSFPSVDYLKDLFFLNNYLIGRWGQTWSLDVEEFFYLILPFLFYIIIRIKIINLKTLTYIYLFLLVEGILLRSMAVYHSTILDLPSQYCRTHFRLDGLFLGVLLSYIYNFCPEILAPIIKRKFLFLTIASLTIAMDFILVRSNNLWEAVVMVAVNPIAFSVLIIFAVNQNKGFKNKFLELIGRNSYSIYLWHFVFVSYGSTLVIFINHRVSRFADIVIDGYSYKTVYMVYLVVYLALAIPVGLLFTKVAEKPFLKIRDRYFPSKGKIISSSEPEKVLSGSVS